MNCLYILEINPLSIASFANIFYHFEGCLFILFMVSFAVQKLLSLLRSHMFIFVFIFITVGGGSKKDLALVYVKVFFLCQTIYFMYCRHLLFLFFTYASPCTYEKHKKYS